MRLLIQVLFAAALLGQGATAQTRRDAASTLSALSTQFEELVEKVDPAVVQVITRGFAPAEEEGGTGLLRARRGSGSGVLVDPSGYIITNAHVVGTARRVQVLLPQPSEEQMRFTSVLKPAGKLVPARVVGTDRETDIAVLKIEGTNLPNLKFGDSEKLRQGQMVFAFGSPFGLENSVTMGVVSSVHRQVRQDDPMIYIQTDASINPGNSGGPLVNPAGEVVGINTFILTQSGGNEGVGFAAPSNIARSVYEQIRKHGRVRRGRIGVIAQTITPAIAAGLGLPRDWGVILADVEPSAPAHAAGLEVRDIVLALNGKPMENARQFGVNIYQNAGETITLDVLRAGKEMKIRVAVAERPQDPERILALVSGDANIVPKLGILAVDLDEKVMPLLPTLRKLSGAVVAGIVADMSSREEPLAAGDVIYSVNNMPVRSLADLKAGVEKLPQGQPVVLHLERLGRLQYVVFELE
jgi:serine protease Do